jgi:hypothetical protein
MPERWERELGKLSILAAPPSTQVRVAVGPHGEGMPASPRRGQRVAAGVVAFAVFGGATALALGAFGRQPSPAPVGSATPASGSVTIELRGDDSGPSAELRYGGVIAQPQIGSYCWAAGGVQRCVDTALTAFAAGDFVDIPSGAPILIDAPVGLTNATTTMGAGDNPDDWIRQTRLESPASSIQGEPGARYLVIVTANWPQGTVQFFFPVEVTDATPTPTPSLPSISGTPVPSLGTVVVPDVVGLQDEKAMQALDSLGLTWTIAYRDVLNVPEWQVSSQTPQSGTEVEAGDSVELVVATMITSLPTGAAGALACAPSDQVAFGGPNVRIEPGGSAYIVGNLGGIDLSDKVVQVTFTDRDWYGLWHVIRKGDVLAVVDFGSLDGVACARSGIAGA